MDKTAQSKPVGKRKVKLTRDKTVLRRNAVPKTTLVKQSAFGLRHLENKSALDFVRGLPDKYFDAVITDFPYGNNTDYGETYDDTLDNLKALISVLVPHLLRVANRVAIFTGVENMYEYPKPTWTLCWKIPGSVGSCKWGFPGWQPILVYGPDPYLANRLGRRNDSAEISGSAGDSIHPCPKPLSVMRWIVERVTLHGEHVYDPLMGRGTTVAAALLTGRSASGTEVSPIFFDEARRTIELAQAQMIHRDLFVGSGGRMTQMDFVPMGG